MNVLIIPASLPVWVEFHHSTVGNWTQLLVFELQVSKKKTSKIIALIFSSKYERQNIRIRSKKPTANRRSE